METVKKEHFQIAGGDIICVASKICSLAEGDVVDLKQVVPTSLARKI
ncbi:coenzyme F420-0:L-glutamate ligase [uncultured Lactobacillus sp.]